jgi:hypothetical protein
VEEGRNVVFGWEMECGWLEPHGRTGVPTPGTCRGWAGDLPGVWQVAGAAYGTGVGLGRSFDSATICHSPSRRAYRNQPTSVGGKRWANPGRIARAKAAVSDLAVARRAT